MKLEDILKDMDGSWKTTSNKMAYVVKEIIEEHIQKDVYDYYDKIRSGDYESAYERTWMLLDSVHVKRSRNRAFVTVDYDEDILDYLSRGSNDWKNSIIYSMSKEKRQRDFFNNALKDIDEVLDNFMVENMAKYGFKIFRK